MNFYPMPGTGWILSPRAYRQIMGLFPEGVGFPDTCPLHARGAAVVLPIKGCGNAA